MPHKLVRSFSSDKFGKLSHNEKDKRFLSGFYDFNTPNVFDICVHPVGT